VNMGYSALFSPISHRGRASVFKISQKEEKKMENVIEDVGAQKRKSLLRD